MLARSTTHWVQIVGCRIIRRRIALREDGDHRAVEVVNVLDQRDGLFTTYVEGSNGAGKQHRVANRQHRELIAELDVLF